MIFAEFDRRAERRRTFRIRLGVQMGTTFAYGSPGIAVAGPVPDGKPFGPGQMIALAFGLVCAYFALYYAPEGEDDGSV